MNPPVQLPRFYVEAPLETGARLTLPAAAARHAAQALRLKPGAGLTLFNGKGGEYQGRLAECSSQGVVVDITGWTEAERTARHRAHLGLCILKREAMAAALARATELGAAQITPLASRHSAVSPKAARQRLGHWRRAVIASCEQCGMNRLPRVSEPTQLDAWLAEPHPEARFVALPEAPEARPAPVQSDFALLIGPEGGMAESEVRQALDAGFAPISLGPRLLRAETAPLAALALLMPF